MLGAAAGVVSGFATALFLFLLDLALEARLRAPDLTWLLPALGFLLSWLFLRFGGRSGQGHDLILDEIHEPRELVPAPMAPLVLAGTLLTHLGGGSAGREGAAVQISASLADQLGRWRRLSPGERRALLMAGAGAGFGVAIGTPLAGVLFGMEMVHAGRLRALALVECAAAGAAAFAVARLLHVPHMSYPAAEVPALEWPIPLLVVVFGALFGLAARLFVALERALARGFARIAYPPLRAFCGGLLLVALYSLLGTLRYAGLGLDVVAASLRTPASLLDPLCKLGLTALTLASGFKGGEWVPLVFIGATLGSALAAWAGLSVSLFASLGFAAVFAAGANTPIACAVMAAELFGWKIFPYALLCCYVAYLASGHPGLYRAQPLRGRKHEGLFTLAGSFRSWRRSGPSGRA